MIFTAVPLCDTFNGYVIVPCRQTACFHAFFWTQSEHVNSCARSEKHAFGQSPPRCPPRIWRRRPYHIVNYAFRRSPRALFTTMLLLVFFFFAVESGWMERMGVGVLDFTAIAACFQHGRGHVCGCGQGQSVALVKYTSPLHKSQQLWSQPKIMPKRLFWNKFSTLDVSCSCPLCSIGSYFGEASLGAFI